MQEIQRKALLDLKDDLLFWNNRENPALTTEEAKERVFKRLEHSLRMTLMGRTNKIRRSTVQAINTFSCLHSGAKFSPLRPGTAVDEATLKQEIAHVLEKIWEYYISEEQDFIRKPCFDKPVSFWGRVFRKSKNQRV